MRRAASLLFGIFLAGCAREDGVPLAASAASPAAASTPAPPAPPSAPGAPAPAKASSPTLVIGTEDVSLDGEPSGSTGALSTLTAPQRLDTLYLRLGRLTGEGKPPVLDVRVDDAVPKVVVVSALTTAAQAGLDRMRFGDLEVTYDAPFVDPTGRFAEIGLLGPTVALRLRRDGVGVSWQSSEACEQVPADRDVPLADLASALAYARVGIVRIAVAEDVPFHDILAAIRAAKSRAREPLYFRLFTDAKTPILNRACGKAAAHHGRLPPEVIRKVVRSHFGAFRACYEDGLRQRASLHGLVRMRFVIGRDGRVSDASIDESTTLSDGKVTDCIRAEASKLVFPKPDGGVVTVVYPLVFNPGD